MKYHLITCVSCCSQPPINMFLKEIVGLSMCLAVRSAFIPYEYGNTSLPGQRVIQNFRTRNARDPYLDIRWNLGPGGTYNDVLERKKDIPPQDKSLESHRKAIQEQYKDNTVSKRRDRLDQVPNEPPRSQKMSHQVTEDEISEIKAQAKMLTMGFDYLYLGENNFVPLEKTTCDLNGVAGKIRVYDGRFGHESDTPIFETPCVYYNGNLPTLFETTYAELVTRLTCVFVSFDILDLIFRALRGRR